LVTATKGKYVRAEPIYSLYEQGKIYHIGQFPILESQMITFDPEKGKSPDRVDALVWGMTDLMLGSQRVAFGIIQ
jgi:phage terminase large subunit-like protein